MNIFFIFFISFYLFNCHHFKQTLPCLVSYFGIFLICLRSAAIVTVKQTQTFSGIRTLIIALPRNYSLLANLPPFHCRSLPYLPISSPFPNKSRRPFNVKWMSSWCHSFTKGPSNMTHPSNPHPKSAIYFWFAFICTHRGERGCRSKNKQQQKTDEKKKYNLLVEAVYQISPPQTNRSQGMANNMPTCANTKKSNNYRPNSSGWVRVCGSSIQLVWPAGHRERKREKKTVCMQRKNNKMPQQQTVH